MKKITYLLGMFVAALMLTSCNEGTDYDIDYTPLAPIGGQYDVTIYYGVDNTKTDAEFWATATDNDIHELGMTYAYLSNTTDYDRDKAWIRIGGYAANSAFNINAKISINMGDFTFGGTDVDNFSGNSATAVDKATVSGFVKHNGITTEASGTTTDYIEFTYSRTNAPGYHFKAVGWKYTGWDEDEE